MLWIIFIVLMTMWLLGMISSYTVGGYIHLVLVAALIVLVFQFITGARSVK